MKPILLKIKGLNSFVEQQKIEFYKLTEKGLFGIFGPTGSGKSSILDAITIALYGKVTRDNKGFINTESDKLEVEYRFSIGVGKNKKNYVCERCIKSDNKGGYKTTLARVCSYVGEQVEVLAEGAGNVKNQVESIVGLSAEDFMRSVVLPQGKFSEFLSLTGIQRRNMLERIFKLERYGQKLRDKIKSLKDQQEKLLIDLNGQLSRFQGVSKENTEILRKELCILEDREKKLKEDRKKIDKLYQEYKVLWTLKEELENYNKEYGELIKNEEEIKNNKIKLQYAKNAINVKPFVDGVKDSREKIHFKEVNLKENNDILKYLCKELQQIQNDYEAALKNQRDKIPGLIKMSTELSRALEIDKKVQIVKKEKKKLEDDYKHISSNMKKLSETFLNIKKEREDLVKKLEDLDKSINSKSITPEYRNLIYSAYDKYSKYVELNKNVVLLKEKHANTNKSLEKNRLEFEKIKNEKVKKDSIVTELLEKRKSLHECCPGNAETLVKAQQEFNSIKEKYQEAFNYCKNKKELEEKHSHILEDKGILQENLKSLEYKHDSAKKELKHIEETIKSKVNGNMAAMLAKELQEGMPCPVCGSTHHIKTPDFVDENILEDLKIKAEKVEKEIEKFKGLIDECKIKLAGVNRDEEHALEELNAIKNKLKDVDINYLEENKKGSEKHFNELREKIEKWNDEIAKLEKNLDKDREEKSDIDKIYTSIKEKIANEETNLENTNVDLQRISKEYNLVLSEYKSILNNLNINNVEEEVNKIKTLDEELVKLKNIEKDSRSRMEKINIQREEIYNQLSKLDSERAKIEQSGKEKKNFIEEYEKEIKSVCGDEDLQEATKRVNEEIEQINNLENNLRQHLEEKKSEKNKVESEKASLEKNLEMLRELLEDQWKNLEHKLEENGFKNEQEVLESLTSKENILVLEEKVTKYMENKVRLEDNIKRVEGKIGDNQVDREQWQEIQNKKYEIETFLNTSIEVKAQKRKELVDMEKDLEQVNKLLKLKEKYQHEYGLYEELDSLVKGNKFVEFVAMNELKYISLEASKRLKGITRGRYALEIDEDGNFIMRDDFNGGSRRHTSTLSGGETFLTSLSLALALSSQIQLKGNSPLEFFFLDEGFGTLDSELLDVVMTSLEKLRTEELSVGIITHVEELKNRVPVKLIVTPCNPGINGTLVNIEYS